MSKRKFDSIIKRLRAEQVKIAKSRDKLRELQDEIETIFDGVNMGVEDLECAIDKLSEQQ